MVNFSDAGGIADNDSLAVQWINADLLNITLQTLQQGATLIIEGKYFSMGGIYANDLTDVTILLDGEIVFSANTAQWPRGPDGRVLECIELWNPSNVTFTSSEVGGGVLDGRGWAWWHLPAIGYLIHTEDRPRLLRIYFGTNILMENWLLLNPAYWATYLSGMDGLEIRFSGVMARRTGKEGHSLEDMTAFNSDGFDVSGRNVWIHDCNIWCQDDAIAVKDNSENFLFERINASGVGLTIGSIGQSQVRNITFRDCYLYKSFKGIYMKFRNAGNEEGDQPRNGSIEDVLFENIVMDEPEHFPIWIGPAQQSDTRDICYPNPCSICWPLFPGAQCEGQKLGTYRNITLRNISINRPHSSAGVLIAHENNPMEGVTFDSVLVDLCGEVSFGSMSSSFPLLPSDRYALHMTSDRFVTSWRLLSLALAAAVIGAIWKWRSHVAELWKTSAVAKVSALLALTIIIPSVAWFAREKSLTSKQDSYFMCSGVEGVATGNTWPVPSCFSDETVGTRQSHQCPSSNWLAPALVMGCAFLATSAYFVYSKRRKCIVDEFGSRDGQNDDASSYRNMNDERTTELIAIPPLRELS